MLSNIRRLVLETYSIAVNLQACDHCLRLGLITRDWSVRGSRAMRRKGTRSSTAVETFGDVMRLTLKQYFGNSDTWMLHKNAGLFQKTQVQEFSDQ